MSGEAAFVRPGDTLILRFSKSASLDQADRIRKGVMALLPELDDVILIVCDQIVVYRPDETNET